MSETVIGWDGKCAEHRTMNTIARQSLMADGAPRTAMALHGDCHRMIFFRILDIHCAAGHIYTAIDLDDAIHDPFSLEDEVAIFEAAVTQDGVDAENFPDIDPPAAYW